MKGHRRYPARQAARSSVLVFDQRQIAGIHEPPALALALQVAFERHAQSSGVGIGDPVVLGLAEVRLDGCQRPVDHRPDGDSTFRVGLIPGKSGDVALDPLVATFLSIAEDARRLLENGGIGRREFHRSPFIRLVFVLVVS